MSYSKSKKSPTTARKTFKSAFGMNKRYKYEDADQLVNLTSREIFVIDPSDVNPSIKDDLQLDNDNINHILILMIINARKTVGTRSNTDEEDRQEKLDDLKKLLVRTFSEYRTNKKMDRQMDKYFSAKKGGKRRRNKRVTIKKRPHIKN